MLTAGRARMRQRRAVPALLAGGLALLLGGCAAAPAPAASSPAIEPPSGVSVIVVQNRTDLAVHRMQIRVVNDGAAPLTVTHAQYTDARFAEPADWTGDTLVPAGTARDLPVPIPPADCAHDGEATGEVELGFADAAAGLLTVEPTDPFDMVDTVTGAECAAAAVQEAADIELLDGVAFEGTGTGQVAILTLRVAVRGDAPVTIDEVQGTVLLQPEDGTITWTLDATTEPGTTRDIPLRVIASRCDPHVVAEDKVGTLLPVLVTVEGEEQAQLILAASTEQRAELYDYVGRRCGWT